ncbi:MAG: SDR family oxidoreductase [Deltaproteobacteria bacterium]
MIDFSGKRGLVLGVGNQRSIAWAVVERLHQQGAELGLTFLRDPKGRFEANVRKLGEQTNSTLIAECDVASDESIEALIKQVDERLLGHLQEIAEPSTKTPINSETPGSIIDRLSISALKIFHMEEQVNRADAAEDHRQRCQAKLLVLKEQRSDLGNSLSQLWEDLLHGRKQMKIYRQMKMYNDATLNPVLYRRSKG